MKFIHSVIAICLILITANLYFPTVEAEVAGMDWFDLITDADFVRGVKHIVTDFCETHVIEIYDLPVSPSLELSRYDEGDSLLIRCR